tara:strand:+ start:38803 stop:38976 length:174 start_codon:yes stop_codon:yes gene_type:complete
LYSHSAGGRLDYARRIESAGANALELQLYVVVTAPEPTSADIEDEMDGVVASVAYAR